jgi:GT2 family glycosyltransferase
MADLSIIIVNFNTKNLLRNCLVSIYKTTKNVTFEIIVVENASTDGSAEMVKREFHEVKLIKNRENRGFAAANNQGIKRAQGKLILLLNSDTTIKDNAIGKSVNFLRNKSNIGALGCKLLNTDGSPQPSAKINFSSLWAVFLTKMGILNLLPQSFRQKYNGKTSYENTREVAILKGAFLLLRKKALCQVGLLDEQFFMYAEEVDLCFRLKAAGWKICFFPDAQIIHHGSGSIKSFDQKLKMQGQRIISSLYFTKKHHSTIYYFISRCLGAIFNLLKLIALYLRLNRKQSKIKEIQAKLRAFVKMKV